MGRGHQAFTKRFPRERKRFPAVALQKSGADAARHRGAESRQDKNSQHDFQHGFLPSVRGSLLDENTMARWSYCHAALVLQSRKLAKLHAMGLFCVLETPKRSLHLNFSSYLAFGGPSDAVSASSSEKIELLSIGLFLRRGNRKERPPKCLVRNSKQ